MERIEQEEGEGEEIEETEDDEEEEEEVEEDINGCEKDLENEDKKKEENTVSDVEDEEKKAGDDVTDSSRKDTERSKIPCSFNDNCKFWKMDSCRWCVCMNLFQQLKNSTKIVFI